MSAARETTAAGLKLVAFAVFSVLVVVTIAGTISPIGTGGAQRSYSALFDSASRVQPGDEVRVAGVPVGRVTGVRLDDDARAVVDFAVEEDLALSTQTQVEIRYLNLVGDRYVALTDDGSTTQAQPAGSTIGLERTRPALDLNDLLNGFKPLFAALSPDDVNALSLDIVQTLQGDGSTVQSLLRHTAALTTGLAKRDELIGDVVTNLDRAVGTVADRQGEVTELVKQLRRYTSGLAKDRETIGTAIEHVDEMTRLGAELVEDVRPSLKADIAHLRKIAETINEPENTAEVEHALDHLPSKLDKLSRTASYGSWFNYYLCSVEIKLGTGTFLDPLLAKVLENVLLVDTSDRCRP